MQQVRRYPEESRGPVSRDSEYGSESPDDTLNARPERLLSWLDMAERYYREAVNRNA